jgi:hypothetical protein
MPFTRKNLKRDLDDLGSNFDGSPDLEFRAATKALGLELLVIGAPNLGDNPRGDVEGTRDWWTD